MDSLGEGARAASIAPPTWTTPQATASRAGSPSAEQVQPARQEPTEAAMRWRLRAASLDYLIVYAGYLLLCLMLHWRPIELAHLILLTLAVAGYHFALESRDGQTIGKRRYGLRVVAVGGDPASPKAIAIRSVLRVIDQFPVFYASGLVSMLRTGPARRQRIGDVAGETKVIAVGGVAARRGTPGWMLPTATILAVVGSVLFAYRIAESKNQPLSSAQRAQFIAGCQYSSSAQAVDCGCLLTRLEADGYTTLSSLEGLVREAGAEESAGQSGIARQALAGAVLGCRS